MELDLTKCVEAHKKAFECWNEGNVTESWYDEDGVLCIKYENGNWWHYRLSKDRIEWW